MREYLKWYNSEQKMIIIKEYKLFKTHKCLLIIGILRHIDSF